MKFKQLSSLKRTWDTLNFSQKVNLLTSVALTLLVAAVSYLVFVRYVINY